jgi:hypothetical protein
MVSVIRGGDSFDSANLSADEAFSNNTWQVAGKSGNVTYTNSNSYAIFGKFQGNQLGNLYMDIGGLTNVMMGYTVASYIIPPGQTYKINTTNFSVHYELR